ncbi:dephospho-CoA kinase [Aliidiomarina haloalkalitolerans]|uniref:Dephospho-CoA kinase n=1 Tax=Aliidiomarina haloalkalitolerans TaxID=859059 RepID=A0A432VSX6_9GAMM|nr:dephospho-CoA kinase [Aliidiomarina haloalkalitolerans]MCL4408833.1 dephospho-CoA kinase [Gammaproteobacteria bacterium]RUO19496.1 dephospho-CoA kinase [Aliidiomarina haloalkalitolerans]
MSTPTQSQTKKEPWILGVTGGIGSGKSTATERFAAHGIVVVDADEVARQVVAPGSDVLAKIAKQFGPRVLTQDGSLNRAELRQIIFADPEAKAWLNQLMHPAIRSEMLQQLQAATSPYVILSAPLLLENGLEQYCQRVLVIDVAESVQRERTQARDQVSSEQVNAILASQLNREQRVAKADDIVDNSGSVRDLQEKIDRLHEYYLRIALSA